MKKNFLIFLLISVTQYLSAQSNSLEILKALNQDWLNSIAKKDSVALGKILTEDFIMINPRGAKLTKKDNLLNVISSKNEFTSINIDSVSVRLLTKDIGIVSCWTSFAFKADGKEMAGKNCYQDVYIKRDGKWLAVSAHVTLL